MSSSKKSSEPKDREHLIREVTQRVWEMLREELRREQERRSTTRRKR